MFHSIKNILLILNLATVIFTVGSYVAPYISPATSALISLVGLIYPALLMANLIFIGLWLVISPKKALISVVTLLIGANSLFNLIGFQSNSAHQKNKKVLKVGSFNLQFAKPITLKEGGQRKILERGYSQFLNSSKDIDIFCAKEHNEYIANQIKKRINYPYLYSTENNFVSIYSKYPIVNQGIIKDFSNNPAINCIWVDVLYAKDTLRIYNAHLEPTTQSGRIAKAVDETAEESPVNFKIAWNLLQHYSSSSSTRVTQARKIMNHKNRSPYPTILCLDLNDTPQSHAYHLISNGLKDSFRKRGNGLGATFGSTLSNKLLSLRIDYILADPSFNFISHQISPNIYSDHHLITAILEW